jgi:hypothetical protein
VYCRYLHSPKGASIRETGRLWEGDRALAAATFAIYRYEIARDQVNCEAIESKDDQSVILE